MYMFLSVRLDSRQYLKNVPCSQLFESSIGNLLNNLYTYHSAHACPDKTDQRFEIIKIIVIADDALAVIDNACLLIALQTVQQFLLTVPPCKLRKRTRLDLFGKQPPAAVRRLAFKAAAKILFDHAFPVLTPLRIPAPRQFQKAVPFASFAFGIL